MLRVCVGNDVVQVRAKAHALFVREGIQGALERISADVYRGEQLREALATTSLFGETPPLFLDFLSEDTQALTDFEKNIALAAESPRTVWFVDLKPSAALEKKLKAHAFSYEEVQGVVQARERFNTFLLADALARKDKKSLWVLLVRARAARVSDEEIIGTLFWQLKALRLAQDAKTAQEAGMKEFPFKKAKTASRAFTKDELLRLSETLLSVYHDGHFDTDMEVGLERWCLRV